MPLGGARFDGGELQALEAVYLQSRNPKDLVPLYKALLPACTILLRAYCQKIGLRLKPDVRKEVVHDAVTRLLEMYLKHPNQASMPLASRLHLEIVFQLHEPKKQRHDKTVEIPEEAEYTTNKSEEEPKDAKEFLTILANDTRVQGKRIVVELYRNRYYKRAILAIEKYTPRTWIYQHATELHTIWKLTGGKRSGT